MRAEDVVVEPWIGDVLSRWWERWKPRLAWGLRSLARWWVVVVAGLVTVGLVHFGRAHLRDQREAARIAELQEQGKRDVHDLLAIIGHGVRVSSVTVGPMPQYIGGWYQGSPRIIGFNSAEQWSEPEILCVAGHECVHALFDQAGLSRYERDIESQILEESAAVVLGAHLAGLVFSRRGKDGARLTKKVVASFRSMCSRDDPFSPGAGIMTAIREGKFRELDPAAVGTVVNHFGDEQLVIDLEAICRRHPQPWEAAHEIFRHFRMDRRWGAPDLP